MKKPENATFLDWLVLKIFEDKFLELSKKYLSGRLIDIGCGRKPYKNLLSNIVDEHYGVDHPETRHNREEINTFCTAYEIPLDSNSFDSAICTAVLEHLEEPETAIRECHRLLKPGGYAIYSVPFFWPLHEVPRDFYRYSKFGLKYLFEKAGFKDLEIISLSGFAVTFIQLHLYVLNGKFNKGIIKALRVFNVYAYLAQKFALWFNKYDNSKEYTWMYIVVAKK